MDGSQGDAGATQLEVHLGEVGGLHTVAAGKPIGVLNPQLGRAMSLGCRSGSRLCIREAWAAVTVERTSRLVLLGRDCDPVPSSRYGLTAVLDLRPNGASWIFAALGRVEHARNR